MITNVLPRYYETRCSFFGYIVLIVRYWCTCVSRTQ